MRSVALQVLGRPWVQPVTGLALALLLAGLLIWSSGVDPLAALRVLVEGAVGSSYALGLTVTKATPLLLAGLGVALARHANLWNIGAEGQIYFGGLGAVLVGLYLTGLPRALHVPLALAAGAVLGAAWASIAGALKAWRDVNEVLTTLLANYIAINIVVFLVEGPLRPEDAVYARTERIPASAELPRLLDGNPVHLGLVVALLATVAVYVFLFHTRFGLEFRMTGSNPSAALHAGVRVKRIILLSLTLSGALAGLAGASELQGWHRSLPADFSPGYGFDAIAVALMGLNHPRGIVPAALFFGALRAGAPSMERALGVDTSLVLALQGLAVFFVVVSLAVDWPGWLRRRAGEPEPVEA